MRSAGFGITGRTGARSPSGAVRHPCSSGGSVPKPLAYHCRGRYGLTWIIGEIGFLFENEGVFGISDLALI